MKNVEVTNILNVFLSSFKRVCCYHTFNKLI